MIIILVLLAVGVMLGFMILGQLSREKARVVTDTVAGSDLTTRGAGGVGGADGLGSSANGGMSGGPGAGGGQTTMVAAKDEKGSAPLTGRASEEAGAARAAKLGEKANEGPVEVAKPVNQPGYNRADSAAEVYGRRKPPPSETQLEARPYEWTFPIVAFILMATFLFVLYYLFMAPSPARR